ncbi:MAG: hypothetical protein ACLQME_09695 [Alphaproteobacteria bacterium]
MDDVTLSQIQTRLRRVERQNRVLIALLCGAVGIVVLGAMDPVPKVISVDEIRTHRITLLDPHGGVAAAWYSDENGGLIGP